MESDELERRRRRGRPRTVQRLANVPGRTRRDAGSATVCHCPVRQVSDNGPGLKSKPGRPISPPWFGWSVVTPRVTGARAPRGMRASYSVSVRKEQVANTRVDNATAAEVVRCSCEMGRLSKLS
jgi:hypothetical protein